MSQTPIYHADSRHAVAPTIQDAWITAFVDHGRYLRGWSPRTCCTYQQGLRTLADVALSKSGLASWIRAQQQRGLKPGGINMYARSVNSFLTWAHEDGLLPERLRIRLLPDPPKPLTAISEAEIRRLVLFRPHGRLQIRTWTLIVLLLDTGLRIDEALGLDRASVDLHNCMVRVRGKGNRQRLVPISLECRKRLYVLPKGATAESVFPTYSGLRLSAADVTGNWKLNIKLNGVPELVCGLTQKDSGWRERASRLSGGRTREWI